MINVKRIYEPADDSDGYRILVDRLWPRGVSKQKAGVDLWMKEVAPSDELRKWFNHDREKWDEFRKRYEVELDGKKELLDQLRNLNKEHDRLTLLYGAHDEQHNQAVILKEVLNV